MNYVIMKISESAYIIVQKFTMQVQPTTLQMIIFFFLFFTGIVMAGVIYLTDSHLALHLMVNIFMFLQYFIIVFSFFLVHIFLLHFLNHRKSS